MKGWQTDGEAPNFEQKKGSRSSHSLDLLFVVFFDFFEFIKLFSILF